MYPSTAGYRKSENAWGAFGDVAATTLAVSGASTLTGDVTTAGDVQIANDKKVKYGTDGAALGYITVGQTTDHLIMDLPSSNAFRIRDKDRTEDHTTIGAVGAGLPRICLGSDNADPTLASYWSQNAGTAVFNNPNGGYSIAPGGAVNLTPGSTFKIVMGQQVALKQYATASLPTFAAGDLVFDSTLNKAKVGGAAAWEAITSV